MTNSEKYNFADFTVEHYQAILQKAKESYVFRNYDDYSLDEKFIILRHDVDYSVHRAYKLAQIEASEGIKATYFVLLHSEFYNVFEKVISDLIEKIIGLGHNIGLHFDSHFYEISNEQDLHEKLVFEKGILETIFNIEVNSFCFHITNEFTLSCNKDSYGAMLNAFSEFYQKKCGYCSDSNGYWRFKRLMDIISNQTYPQMQINIHPAWWQDTIMSPKQRIHRCIDLRAMQVKDIYDETLLRTGRINIDY